MAKVYVLRNCREDMTSHDGFVWPKSGYISCPDWSEEKKRKGGLHGFLWGVGDTSLLYPFNNCQWLIVEVDEDKIIDLRNNVKFSEGNVVFCTQSRDKAIEKMIEYGANPNTIMYGTSTSGNNGTSISGDHGISISSDYGNSTSGNHGNSTSGNHGISNSGDHGKSISGNHGKSTSGDFGISNSGDFGISNSGDWGTSASGDNGISISGNYGHSFSINGKAKTGYSGAITIEYYESEKNKNITKVGYVRNGLKPNTFYRVVDGEWVETD